MLQQRDYDVTLVTDRTPDQVRSGPVMSSQLMFETALDIERSHGLNHWDADVPLIEGVRFTIREDSDVVTSWQAPFEGAAQSVDQRVKVSAWVEEFAEQGGNLVIRSADLNYLQTLADENDLVVVSTGKGDLGRIFRRDVEKSRFDKPQRVIAMAYVHGLKSRGEHDELSYTRIPDVGEYFVFPALTCSGACDIMVFEGVPGGPLDCWEDVKTPEEQLTRSLELLEKYFPDEADRCANVTLTDPMGVLRGRITPTVRHAVSELPSGVLVLGMADAVVLNDPLTGQGSNHAAKSAEAYFDAIIRQGDNEFDSIWMQRTFDQYWRGWGQWSVQWTNSLLVEPPQHLEQLLIEAADNRAAAADIANGFDDPRLFYPWWFDAGEARHFLEQKQQQLTAAFDERALRNAFGQFATGVTVVTSRAPDGRRIGMTANSFASVSLDPPLVMWCPAKSAPSVGDFRSASHFAVNVLSAHQHALSRQFATPLKDKFAGVEVTEGLVGLPLLSETVCAFECRTVATYDAGDHVIFVGEIERYSATGGDPLVFHAGAYQVATKHPDI
ncbi:flavin reductase [Nocardioides taihuensis]|uniref:Flavin reductase n=1 Tax=Nocardioides taihuensis TaxID=1835606 RepID=A0ABW0BED7_9ACTN